ncbi:MAG TPA: competence/damage-inducible protein A [Candidatus Dorea intestinavium]|nr:competence/damage-inducible protein A [Candidatus Dorea intestinavium]
MIAEIVTVGTEILMGNIINTNAAYLAKKCAQVGLDMYHQTVIGDNKERLRETIKTALDRSDIIFLTGGLGPTDDDITKEVTAQVFGLSLYEDTHTKERIEDYFQNIKAKIVTNNNWKQALVPEGAFVVDNHNGTAPGLIIEEKGKMAILLPGPPGELKPMMEEAIIPYLEKKQPEKFYSQMVKVLSVGESRVETLIKDLIEKQSNPTIAPYAKIGEVHLRVTAKARDAEEAKQLMAPIIKELEERFGDNIYTTKEEVTLEEEIVRLLKEKNLKVTFAESCTAGLLAGRLVNVPGASSVFEEGFITYSNEAKNKMIGVSTNTLEAHGAVSHETAKEMALGAAKKANAEAAVSITGIAGPQGGTKEKPVGLVYIGVKVLDSIETREYHFTGNRTKNRESAVVKGLTFLRERLLQVK